MKIFLMICFICSVSFSIGQNTKSGLIAYWPLDGNAVDMSGSSFNGVITNVVPTQDRFMTTDGAMSFSGNSYINFGDILDMGYSNMTYSAWIKFAPSSTAERAAVSKTQHPSNFKIGIGINVNRPAALFKSTVNEVYVVDNNTVLDQQWHLLTATYDRNGFLKLYLDGVFLSQGDISSAVDVDMQSPFDFMIGAGDDGSGSNVNFNGGSIDDVRIYNRVLTGEEVLELYNAPDPKELNLSVTRQGSFQLEKGNKYIVSCWVREDIIEQVAKYSHTKLGISFNNDNNFEYFEPSGEIIDGWQRIIGEFTVPVFATEFNFSMISEVPLGSSYFDDLRIVPFNGSMKSFVYDPETQKLVAELDENNYGTFYEYDQEGGLIRVKKETENGIYTIQETRSSNSKPAN